MSDIDLGVLLRTGTAPERTRLTIAAIAEGVSPPYCAAERVAAETAPPPSVDVDVRAPGLAAR